MTRARGRDDVLGWAPPGSRHRYFASRWWRVVSVALAVALVTFAVLGRRWEGYVSAGAALVSAADACLAPGTVADAAGLRTRRSVRRRTVAWADVAEVLDAGPGLPPLQVKVLLTTGRRLPLPEVRAQDVPHLRELLAQSRQTAPPTGPAGPPSP